MIKQNFTGKKLGAKGLKDFVAYFGIPESHMRIMESFDLSSDHSLIIVTYSTVAHILQIQISMHLKVIWKQLSAWISR